MVVVGDGDGGEVVGVVVGGGEVGGVVVGAVEVVGVVEVGARGGVVVTELPLLVGAVPVVGEGVGMVVVTPDGVETGLWANVAVTTTDHFPHISVTFPLTCPVDVSPENQ